VYRISGLRETNNQLIRENTAVARWLGSMKSRNCLVVNWNRVESLRDWSNGSIIGALGNN
jgi:hypothetical protein